MILRVERTRWYRSKALKLQQIYHWSRSGCFKVSKSGSESIRSCRWKPELGASAWYHDISYVNTNTMKQESISTLSDSDSFNLKLKFELRYNVIEGLTNCVPNYFSYWKKNFTAKWTGSLTRFLLKEPPLNPLRRRPHVSARFLSSYY